MAISCSNTWNNDVPQTIEYLKSDEAKTAYKQTAGTVVVVNAGVALEGAGAIVGGLKLQGLNFTKTTAAQMEKPGRYVPVEILKQAIKGKVCVPDPKGTTSAFMYYTKMYKNGKTYTLEVLYDEASNTVLHFMYY